MDRVRFGLQQGDTAQPQALSDERLVAIAERHASTDARTRAVFRQDGNVLDEAKVEKALLRLCGKDTDRHVLLLKQWDYSSPPGTRAIFAVEELPSDEPRIAVVVCKADGKSTWKFMCPFCRRLHTHGAGEGHRVAHCDHTSDSYFYKHGYTLRLKAHNVGAKLETTAPAQK